MNPDIEYLMEDVMVNISSTGSMSSLVSIAVYVFVSLSMYTIAKRRGIQKAWLAWIPVGNMWILGSLSDQYRYVVKGQVKNKRKVMLTLSLINAVLGAALFLFIIVKAVAAAMSAMNGISESAMMRELLSAALAMLAILLPVLVISIVVSVLECIALYDVYRSCDPENSVLYLVLSIIPGISTVAYPLFMFLCRNLDKGMPPRRETAEEI